MSRGPARGAVGEGWLLDPEPGDVERRQEEQGEHGRDGEAAHDGESFERNVGAGSILKIDRGLNKLWTQGGLQYAPPIR